MKSRFGFLYGKCLFVIKLAQYPWILWSIHLMDSSFVCFNQKKDWFRARDEMLFDSISASSHWPVAFRFKVKVEATPTMLLHLFSPRVCPRGSLEKQRNMEPLLWSPISRAKWELEGGIAVPRAKLRSKSRAKWKHGVESEGCLVASHSSCQ